MTQRLLLKLLVLAAVVCTQCPGWAAGYSYYRAITINPAPIQSDLTNFPVLVSLALGSGKIQSPQCYDIFFTSDQAGNNILPFEREQCTPSTGNVTAWVKVPLVNGSSHSSGTTIYAYYGNSSASSDLSAKTRVWTASYQWVMHLSDTAANTTVAESANGFTATSINNVNTSSLYTPSGQVAGAFAFDGNSDGLRYGSFTIGTTSTISAWLNPSQSSGTQNIVANGNVSGLFVDSGKLAYYDGTTYYHGNTSLAPGHWYYVTAVEDGANIQYYVNGNPDGSYASKAITFNPNGTSNASQTKFAGTIDEIEISNTARTGPWIAAAYNNQSAPSNFYNLGPEISLGAPGGPTITTLSPNFGAAGAPVTISGTNFGSSQGTSTVLFNGLTAAVINWGPTAIAGGGSRRGCDRQRRGDRQ